MNTAETNTVSEARLRANRENAKKSTGPRSSAGRAISSRNALKHGLCSDQPFLRGEEPEGFHALVDDLSSTFQPVGEAEETLILRIAAIQWRLGRTFPMEAAILRDRMNFDVADRDKFRKIRHDDQIEYAIEDEEPAPPPLPDPVLGDLLGRAFMADCRGTKAISLLTRYEAALERSLDRCLRLLKYFQTTRLRQRPNPQPSQERLAPPANPPTTPSKPMNYETNPKPHTAPPSLPAPAPVQGARAPLSTPNPRPKRTPTES